MKHIAFTGGGSGGHIMPIASLIEYGLQDTEINEHCKLFWFGEANSMEAKICTQFPSVTFLPIPAGKFRRYRSAQAVLHNIRDLRRGIKGIFVAWRHLQKLKITSLLCKWGYVALPVCIAAYILRIPLILHESDTHAGMTNRLVAKMAKVRFVWFPGILPPSRPIGQLLSPKLLHPDTTFLPEGFAKDTPVVLVMGGSQGASTLFDWLLHYLPTPEAAPFQFIVLLWSKNSSYAEAFAPYANVHALQFIEKPEHMARLYQIADLSITRGSATSLAEQHLYNIHKIIVPTPFTWGNHQRYNWLRYRDTYNDHLFTQDNELSNNLTTTLATFTTYKKTPSAPPTTSLTIPLREVRNELLDNK